MTARAKAQEGLGLSKAAALQLLEQIPEGLTNAQIAEKLDLHSDYLGGQKDYLSWSVLGLLLNDKQIRRSGRKYFPNRS